MVKVVRHVVKFGNFGEMDGVQILDDDGIPLLSYFAPLFPTAFKLELL